MATLKLIFFNWDNFFCNIIKSITDCKYGHVGAILSEDNENYYVGEMLVSGKTRSPYSKGWYEQALQDGVAEIVDTGLEIKTDVEAVFTSLDYKEGYDWFAILKNLLHVITGKAHWAWKNSHAAICSELAGEMIVYVTGVDIAQKLNSDIDAISPADLYNYFKK